MNNFNVCALLTRSSTFGPKKEALRGKHCACDNAVNWLKEQSTDFYKAGIHALNRMWNITFERNSDYIQK